MATRGRKSAASLELATVSPVQVIARPICPHDLGDEEAEVWFAVVNRLPADWFPAETLPLLVQYCRQVVQARRIAELIEKATGDVDEDGKSTLSIKDYDRLLKMQDRESRGISSLATKMRISQQATTNHRGNAKGEITGKKPWES